MQRMVTGESGARLCSDREVCEGRTSVDSWSRAELNGVLRDGRYMLIN